MKSYAPSLVVRTAVSMVPWPDIMTTGMPGQSLVISWRIATPSRPGSQMSRSTRSTGCSRSRRSADSPSSTRTGR